MTLREEITKQLQDAGANTALGARITAGEINPEYPGDAPLVESIEALAAMLSETTAICLRLADEIDAMRDRG